MTIIITQCNNWVENILLTMQYVLGQWVKYEC